MQSLRNALDTRRSDADRIIQTGPAITWLSYSVHGDEISSTDAAMLTAYHLLASRGDSRGFVIAFTQDPTIRAYLDGLNVIFANAIFRGAAHARPMH